MDEDEVGYGYGIESTGDGVLIKLGPVIPFEIDNGAAIRLSALLCKKAGCEVLFRQGSMKIKFPRGFEFGQEVPAAMEAEDKSLN
jgi:hypothetical protein